MQKSKNSGVIVADTYDPTAHLRYVKTPVDQQEKNFETAPLVVSLTYDSKTLVPYA